MHGITRRGLMAGMATFAVGMTKAQAESDNAIASIERRYGGRLGVFVLDTGSGRTLTHRADERFLLCSTFKGLLAALILSRVDAGRDRFDNIVRYGKQNLLGHSPVTAAHVQHGGLPVGVLCAATILFSDNAAANLLLARVGGPAALTDYLRSLGDPTTRSDRYELAAGDRSGDLDTTTPRAIAGTARTLLLGDELSPDSRALLEGWMIASTTGANRLRAAFPPEWVTADKTGTGAGECNDYAVVRRPGRAPLVMAAYYDRPGMDTAAQEAVLREAGSAIVDWANG